MVGELLDRAAAALVKDDRLGALDALLEAWRERRAPVLGDTIDALSHELARALPAITGKSGKQRHERWLDVAGLRRAVDVPRLLAMLDEGMSGAIKERVERLAVRPDDPRVADALLRLCEQHRLTSSAVRPMWTAIFDLLARIGDPRTRPRLDAIVERSLPVAYSTSFRDMFLRRIGQLREALPDPPPALDDDEARTVAEILRVIAALAARPPASEAELVAHAASAAAPRPAGASVAELTALVWADPDDDGPRRVLADLLLERGDPWGEFLTLQLRAASGAALKSAEARRMRQLQKAHQAAWLGPLEPVVDPKSVLFERGFLARCAPRFRTARQRDELLAHPAWATVRELTSVADPALLRAPALARVRRAHGLDAEGLAALSSGAPPLALEALALAQREPVEDPALRARIGDGRGLPRLTELTVGPVWRGRRGLVSTTDWGWLLETPLGARLTLLRVAEEPIYAEGLTVGAWAAAAARHGALTVEAALHVWSWRLARGAAGWELEVAPRSAQSIWRYGFESSLADLAPGQLAAIRLRRAPPVTPADEAALQAIVGGRAPFVVV